MNSILRQVNPQKADNMKRQTDIYFEAINKLDARGGDLSLTETFGQAGSHALSQITNSSIVPTVIEETDKGRISYDVYSRLLKNRKILIEGQVSDQMASIINASLHYLNSVEEDREKLIQMIINSPGGSVSSGLAIYDTMHFIDAPINTIGVGIQMSMGSILLAAGNRRSMTPTSKLMVHQISGAAEGQATDMAVRNSETEKLHEVLKSIYVAHIGLNHKYWDQVMERDAYFNAEQALEIGFIHGIQKNKDKTPLYAASTKREEEGLAAVINEAAKKYIDEMTTAEILAEMNTINASGSVIAPYRTDLIVKLSKDPMFWTPEKAAEMKKKDAANSNTPDSTENNVKKSGNSGLSAK